MYVWCLQLRRSKRTIQHGPPRMPKQIKAPKNNSSIYTCATKLVPTSNDVHSPTRNGISIDKHRTAEIEKLAVRLSLMRAHSDTYRAYI